MNRNRSGLTLVEVTVSMALFSVAMVAAVYSFTSIVRLQQKGATQRQIQQSARLVIETMAREVRDGIAVEASGISATAGNQLIIIGSESAETRVTYSLIDTAGDQHENALVRQLSTPVYTSPLEPITNRNEVRVLPHHNGRPIFEKIVNADNTQSFIRINLRVAHSDETLTTTDPYAYEYELSTVVTTRGLTE